MFYKMIEVALLGGYMTRTWQRGGKWAYGWAALFYLVLFISDEAHGNRIWQAVDLMLALVCAWMWWTDDQTRTRRRKIVKVLGSKALAAREALLARLRGRLIPVPA